MPNLQSLLIDAQAAYSRGQLEAAARILEELLKVSPVLVEANVLMAIVLARKGNLPEAIAHLHKALAVKEDCYEAHVALSTLLFADNRVEDAMRHGRRAIALQPKDPASYHHLARDLIAHRLPADAVPYLRQALSLAPASPSLIQDLATALGELEEHDEPVELWTKLTRLHPTLLVGWLKLGGLLLADRRFNDALACGRKAVKLAPESVDAQLLISFSHMGGEGGAGAAEAHLSKAVQLQPDGILGLSAYGLALHEMGRFDEARPQFEKVVKISPAHGQAYYSLVSSRKTTDEDRPLLVTLRQHLDDPAASPLDRSYMHYALGKAHEDFGDYELSIGHYDAATALASQSWFANRPPNRERYAESIQATIETFTPSFLAAPARERLESQTPLLVVGMIRSGTTLVEQILSSHPEVKGAGEQMYWHEEAPKIWNMAARQVDESGLKTAAQGYLALLDRLGAGHPRVTDKLPHNYTMLGFVLAAIPNARVIYVKRHPVDNCLSIYTTAYQRPPEFTLIRSNIVFGYRQHERIMSHWRSVLPAGRLLEVEYEELIENREQQTRRMIAFAGLEWSDACLHHESNPRSVNTPSVWQVRQPIYKTSVARWRKFEPWLGEFRELMPG